MRMTSVFTAVAMVLASAGASPVYGAQTLACTFTKECIAGEPCAARDGLTASLAHDGQAWVMTMGDGAVATFSELPGAPAGTMRLISTDLDADASAVALLSVAKVGAKVGAVGAGAGAGQAILSIQGYFPSLGAVTQLGQCTPVGE